MIGSALLLAALFQPVASQTPGVIDLTLPPPCGSRETNDDEVVVCGTRTGQRSPYRLPPELSETDKRVKAETRIADGVTVAGETENADVGGRPSNRAMVRLKIKF